jgi:diguanylate cyclase (GGDEF)-like protein
MVDGSDTVPAVGLGTGSRLVGERLPIEGSLTGLCVRTGQVLSSDNTDSDDRADSDICQRIGAGSMIVVPLTEGGVTVGALNVYTAAIYHFRSKDIEILRLLAGLISAQMTRSSDFRNEVRSTRTDPLTGLGNRRAYEEALAAEIARCRRHDGIVAIALFQLEGFAETIDASGQDAADDAARAVARILSQGRFSDAAFRIEPDQFVMVLPETEEEGAKSAATRISSRIAEAVGPGRISVAWGVGAGEPGAIEMHELAVKRLEEMKARTRAMPATP